jgi:hypothetical protein
MRFSDLHNNFVASAGNFTPSAKSIDTSHEAEDEVAVVAICQLRCATHICGIAVGSQTASMVKSKTAAKLSLAGKGSARA